MTRAKKTDLPPYHELANARPGVDEEVLGAEPGDEVEAAPVPGTKDLVQIRKLAADYTALEGTIARLTKELADANASLKALRENDLPLALTQVGMTSFRLVGGGEVELKTGFVAAITKANKEKAFAWLEKTGHGDLIKHEITIKFGKGEEAWAKKFLRDMAQRKKPLNAVREDRVEFQTLGKFVRDEVARGKAAGVTPEKLFGEGYGLLGVYELRYVDVSLPEAPK